MSKQTLIKPFLVLAVLVVTCCFGSCAIDREYDTPDGVSANAVTITVTIPAQSTPTTRGIADGDGEAAVTQIDVLVFEPNATPGSPDVLSQRATGTIASQSSNAADLYEVRFRAQLTSNSNAAQIVVIANATSVIDDAFTASTIAVGSEKQDVLYALKYASASGSYKWNATSSTNYTPIPMYGEMAVSGISAGAQITGLQLVRMLARVDVISTATNFTLTNVHLVNYNTSGYIAPTWDADGTLSSSTSQPNIPTASVQTGAGNAIVYDFATLAVSGAMNGEIYTYEAAATSGEEGNSTHTNAICLVLEGTVGSDPTPRYYRVDFTEGKDGSGNSLGHPGFDPSDIAYMPVLRNCRYIFTLSAVNNSGYGSLSDALSTLGIMNNLQVDLLVVDESNMINTVFNSKHYLSLSDEVTLDPAASSSGKASVATNYSGGWEIDTSYGSGTGIAYDDPLNTGWLTVASMGSGTTAGTLQVTANSANNGITAHIAYVHIKAGVLNHKLKVTQANRRWAGSNIYWDGSKLTFDDVDDTSHEMYQGVYFKWGSLWGIDPAGTWGVTSTTLYSPSGDRTTANAAGYSNWGDIPYISTDITADQTINYLYDNTDSSAGTGDICKHLTDQAVGGTLHGKKWRMPTSKEFDVTGTANTVYSLIGGSSWSAVTTSSGGTTVLTTGRKKQEVGSTGIASFPASGCRNSSAGQLSNAGSSGYYWSGSPGGTLGFYLYFSSSAVNLAINASRAYGYAVRCVVE